jgi:hypothetical protein
MLARTAPVFRFEAIACAVPASVAWLTWFIILVAAVREPLDLVLSSPTLLLWLGGGFVGLIALWSRVLMPRAGGTEPSWLRALQLTGLVIGLIVAASIVFSPSFETRNVVWWLYTYVCVSASLSAGRHVLLILYPGPPR